MIQMRSIFLWLALTGMTGIFSVNAEGSESVRDAPANAMSSLHALQSDWTFAGMVANENGERYHYFFQIRRNNTHYHGIATVIDGKSRAVLIYEDCSADIEHPELTHCRVGHLFLRFNPINSSWVFGVKNKGKKGFNFKVDMLGLTEAQQARKQDLRAGLELLITQTGRLNGHLQTDEQSKEEFITAKKAWFRQVWVSNGQEMKHPRTSVLCEFNDGSAFYSISESDSLRGSVAGWRNEQGMPVSMSQFVTVGSDKDDLWQIHIPSPKASLQLQNVLTKINEQHNLVAGATKGHMPGFCAISKDEIQQG